MQNNHEMAKAFLLAALAFSIGMFAFTMDFRAFSDWALLAIAVVSFKIIFSGE